MDCFAPASNQSAILTDAQHLFCTWSVWKGTSGKLPITLGVTSGGSLLLLSHSHALPSIPHFSSFCRVKRSAAVLRRWLGRMPWHQQWNEETPCNFRGWKCSQFAALVMSFQTRTWCSVICPLNTIDALQIEYFYEYTSIHCTSGDTCLVHCTNRDHGSAV